MFRRETIIALRARHQAYRIASDILHPHVDAVAPPQPAMPVEPLDLSPLRRPLNVKGLVAAAIIWGFVAAYWLLYWLFAGT